MQLYPAIDIRDGKCVRLTQGKFDQTKVYADSPSEMARLWESMGATFLHLVDLDGALAGRSVNEPAIRAVAEAVEIPIQLGGGIRSRRTVADMLNMGIRRVIIGTKAVEDPEFIRDLIREFGPERIVAGVDARDGLAAVEGWEKVSSLTAAEICARMAACGVRHIVYTDISRDGMLAGPNVAAVRQLTEETGLDIIASGGVSSSGDLEELYRSGVRGAIIGKALYEGRIDLADAVKRFEQKEKTEKQAETDKTEK